jgi:hypothetical protein
MTDGMARSPIGRMLAGLLLAGMVFAFVPLSIHSDASTSMDCAEHHSLPTSSFIGSIPHDDGCDGGPLDWCRAMPGCGFVTPALAGASGNAPAAPLPTGAQLPVTPVRHGSVALGPPTPPPNS